MSGVLVILANVLAIVVMPFLLVGVINRVKSCWSGRKGPPLLQPFYDARRLLRKSPVYSTTATPLFRIAPLVFLVSAVGSALVTPLLGASPVAAFAFDFVWFAYVWGLGRVLLMLAALDTGSAFGGMGAAREATFSTLLEPVVFLLAGALCLLSGTHTLHEALALGGQTGGSACIVRVCAIVSLLIVLQVESARMPVDDPSTHLELTMVHEVMLLDHSGPDLAFVQLGSALKLFVGMALVATLANPWAGASHWLAASTNLVLCILVAALVGTLESLVARLHLRAVPRYIGIALIFASVALLATAWGVGGGP